MATLTERGPFKSVLRIELDHTGATTTRELHQRVETLRDGAVIGAHDTRVDTLDAKAFAASLTAEYAAALDQIDALAASLATMTVDRDAKAAALATMTAARDAALAQIATLATSAADAATTYATALAAKDARIAALANA